MVGCLRIQIWKDNFLEGEKKLVVKMTVTKQKPTTAYNEVNKAYLKSEMRSLGRSKRLGSYGNGLDSDSGSEETEGKVASVQLNTEEIPSSPPPPPPQCPFSSSPQSNTQQSSSNSSSLLSSMLNTAPLCDSSDLLVSFEDLSCKGMSGSGEEDSQLNECVELEDDSDEEEDIEEEDETQEDEEMVESGSTGGSDGENSNPGAKIFCTEHIGSVLLDGNYNIL